MDADLSAADYRAWVQRLRAAQGLPPTVQNPTTLQRVADLMRSAERRAKKGKAS